jgi:hypothetical protein
MNERTEECEPTSQQEIELVEKEQKFSLAKFAVGWAKIITSMSFLAWAVYTALFGVILWWIFANGDNKAIEYLKTIFMYILAGGWVATTFVMAINLQKGIETMVSNAKINAEIKAGFSKNIDLKGTADAAQIIDAVKN